MKELRLKVDRVEDGFAVCYLPEGGMTDIPLPEDMVGAVKDGATIEVKYEGDEIISVSVIKAEDPKSEERRARLDRLFGRK